MPPPHARGWKSRDLNLMPARPFDRPLITWASCGDLSGSPPSISDSRPITRGALGFAGQVRRDIQTWAIRRFWKTLIVIITKMTIKVIKQAVSILGPTQTAIARATSGNALVDDIY